MSTSTADGEVRAVFRAMLSAERAGYKLAVALVSTLVSYLVGTAATGYSPSKPRGWTRALP